MRQHRLVALFTNSTRILPLVVGFWVNSAEATIDETSFYSNFTNTHFVDQSGQRFEPQQLLGKVALFNFIYTKCSSVCPTQTRQLLGVYQKLPQFYQDKIAVISVSLDSQYDKPSVLQQYAHDMKANFRQWQFLSGQYADIKALQEKLFLFGNPANPSHPKVKLALLKTKDKETVLQNHMTILWVVDKRGMLIQRYAASPMDVGRLENELKQIADL